MKTEITITNETVAKWDAELGQIGGSLQECAREISVAAAKAEAGDDGAKTAVEIQRDKRRGLESRRVELVEVLASGHAHLDKQKEDEAEAVRAAGAAEVKAIQAQQVKAASKLDTALAAAEAAWVAYAALNAPRGAVAPGPPH